MKPFYAPGRYAMTVQEQAWTEAKSGSDMLVLKARVDCELLDEVDESGELVAREVLVPQNYTRTIRIVFSQSNVEYAIAKLRHAGFTGRSFDDLNLVGQRVVGVCTEGTYNNQPSEQWDLALPPRDSGPALESKPGVTRKLNAMFGKLLAGTAPPAAQREPAMAVPGGGGADMDDDVPFAPVTI